MGLFDRLRRKPGNGLSPSRLSDSVPLDSSRIIPPPLSRSPLVCPSCSYPNEPNSKFCQDCGSPLQQQGDSSATDASDTSGAEPIFDSPAPARSGITIEFPYSTAASFDAAVTRASRFATFRQVGEGKNAIYQVTFQPHQLDDATELVEHLKGWRRRSVYVDGEKTLWDNIFSFASCYERKKACYKPQFYCYGYENDWQFNLWGCIHTGMPFIERAEWFSWGRWIGRGGDWEFDKGRMRHELERALFKYRYCPALDLARVEDVVRVLPDRVNPTKDRNWQFVEVWEPGAEGLVVTVDRFGFKQKVTMKGVSPKGKGAALQIARQLKLRLPA